MGDIAYQNKDIASKLTGETLVGKNLAVFGLPHLSITGILPLTVKGRQNKQVMIERSVELARRIPERDRTMRALAGILTFSDKVIDEAYKNRIKEEMRMTQIGQMIFEDGVIAGKAEGKELGENDFAALTGRLIEDSRMEDLAKATKDKTYRAVLYREYGIRE